MMRTNVFIDIHQPHLQRRGAVNGPEMIKRGEIDEATIGSDILDSWLADDTTKDMVSMDRPNTNYTYFYMFNFMPFAHEFSNWSVEAWMQNTNPRTGPRPSTTPTSARPSCTASTTPLRWLSAHLWATTATS